MGIITINDYKNLILTQGYSDMQLYSKNFITQNSKVLKPYYWTKDPLNCGSRQYEYPYVNNKIKEYLLNKDITNLRILDAGSGVTFFPCYIQEQYSKAKVYCIDNVAEWGKIYNKINKSIKFYIEDIEETHLETEYYDIIYCISVLEHTKDKEKVIKEFYRLLKKDGVLILTFDISLDGKTEIPISGAKEIINLLNKYFIADEKLEDVEILLKGKDIYTTQYINEYMPEILPWKFGYKEILWDLVHLKVPKRFFSNITPYCMQYKKRNDLNEI